ncbi:MAG: MFS transporter [Burkholderiaceae bacterium]|nr:MFS transporter [Burkholderiaceae bacterium]
MSGQSSGTGAFRALRHRDYRIYFIGTAVSMLGTWMQQIAMGWLVYRVTGSAALLGLITFLTQVPQLVVGPMAGVLTDRVDRRRAMIIIQALLAAQAALLAFLTMTDRIDQTWLIVTAALLGLFNSLDAPLRHSYLPLLVPVRADLFNAIALNSSLFNTARFVGPSLAGVVVALAGEAICFAVNAASFLVVVIALMSVAGRDTKRAASSGFGRALVDGLHYAWTSYHTRVALTMVVLMNFLITPYVVLMPIFAREVFGGDARAFGYLVGAAGVGALAASLLLASRGGQLGAVRSMLLGCVTAALGAAAFSHTSVMLPALLFATVMGFGGTCGNVAANTLIQTAVPDVMRGRVVSLFTASVFGMQALGALAIGSLASQTGAPIALLVAAMGMVLFVIWLWRRVARVRISAAHAEEERDALVAAGPPGKTNATAGVATATGIRDPADRDLGERPTARSQPASPQAAGASSGHAQTAAIEAKLVQPSAEATRAASGHQSLEFGEELYGVLAAGDATSAAAFVAEDKHSPIEDDPRPADDQASSPR